MPTIQKEISIKKLIKGYTIETTPNVYDKIGNYGKAFDFHKKAFDIRSKIGDKNIFGSFLGIGLNHIRQIMNLKV